MQGMQGQTGVAPFLLPMWEHDNFTVAGNAGTDGSGTISSPDVGTRQFYRRTFAPLSAHSFCLRREDKAILLGIPHALRRPACLPRSQRPQSGMFQVGNKFFRPERPSRVCVLPQRSHIAGRLPGGKMLPPFCHRPAVPPTLHFQHSIRSAAAAVRRSARPSPLRRRRHHAGTDGIQLHIAQRSP